MPDFGFAGLEKTLATTVINTFANIALIDEADAGIEAVLTKANANLGEFDLSHEQRLQLVVNKQLYAGLKSGDVLSANPLQYTPDEITAMPQSTFTLDKLAEDDGLIQKWWVL